MEKLAILGGKPVLNKPLPKTNNIDDKEKNAVMEVLDSGQLSDFLGRAGNKFLGGKYVLELEKSMCEKFKVEYSVAFNSATTALEAAVCALGIGPGDEVIVSPYTMAASATAVLMNMAIPIFADIDSSNYCLSSDSVKKKITPNTKALMVTNLFGGSADYRELLKIAKKHNLKIIEDNAQAAGGFYHGKSLGTLADIGIFSFNIHKTMQAGEGGVLVTNDKNYAFRAQLRRNHGESVLDDLQRYDIDILGTNSRMTEVHAAIATEQLKKLDFLNEKRIQLADYLTEKLEKIKGISPVNIIPDTKHVYYLYPMKFSKEKFGISRDLFVKALSKEGFELNQGYVKPLYLIPLFQNKKIFPNSKCPYDYNHYDLIPDYSEGSCPTVEKLWKSELLLTSICRYPITKKHIDMFIFAIEKIYAQRDELK